MKTKVKYALAGILLCCCLYIACTSNSSGKDDGGMKHLDWQQIKEKGELTILTLYSSTSYYIYKDEPMGYDYELALDFCNKNGLKLNVKVAENAARLLEMLKEGEGDVIAFELSIQNKTKKNVIYCGLEQVSHQVLVQRKERGEPLLKNETELIGKEIYVKYDSKYHQRIKNLNAEMGGGIIIKDIERDTVTTEDLIELVANKEIDYTVCDEYLAKLNKTYFTNIDISLPISFEQRMSWAVSKKSPELAKKLNEWYSTKSDRPNYFNISKKYFEQSKREFHGGDLELSKNRPAGTISPYDQLFKTYAKNTKYDWRLLAAISYQECRFRNNETSWAGASGIMGLMPRTAESVGLSNEDRMDPGMSIQASIKILNQLQSIFKNVKDDDERLKFVLAAYNGGMGHVMDGQRLAEKYGANPEVWEDNVKDYIRLKRYPQYYNDPVCKSGLFKGSETIRYVYDVTTNTERFKELTKKKK